MPGDPLAHVNPGDSFSIRAPTYNAWCDAAAAANMRTQFSAGVPQGRNLNMGLALVRNDTGDDLARFSIVGLSDPIIDNSANLAEFQNRITFKGLTPATASHRGKFAILIEPIADGSIGKAVLSGLCQVQIDVGSAAHKYAEITDGDATVLTSGAEGSAQILWQETGTGDGKWAIVRLGPPVPETFTAWAKVQTGHVNFSTGTPTRLASVKLLDDTGTEYGDAFNVYLPWASGKHPAVFVGDKIVVCSSVAGVPTAGSNEPVCLSDCSDDVLYTVKAFAGAVANIPPGWKLCDGTNSTIDLTGRFIMGIDADGQADENTIGDTGGYRQHGETENNHSDHGQHGVTLGQEYVATTPNEVNVVTTVSVVHATEAHSDTDNRPRYYVLAFMERVS